MININAWDVVVLAIVAYVFFVLYKLYSKTKKTEYEFTSIINHTFRTPLIRINWSAKELANINLTREERDSHVGNISNATSRLLEIIDLIVGAGDVKDSGVYVLKETSFRDIVEKSIEKYRLEINKKNLVFKVSSFTDIPFIIIDKDKISFVIDTLIENAIIYTKSNGGITIDCILKKDKLLFYVADTGIGLSFFDRFKIFKKFYRGSRALASYPDGMGLRLYLSKNIIEKHKGCIYAKSKGKNKGTVFFVELPLRG